MVSPTLSPTVSQLSQLVSAKVQLGSPVLKRYYKVCLSVAPALITEACIDTGPDPDLLIPNELVYARVKKERTPSTDYWPAKILEYVWATGRQRKGKYKIRFMDEIEQLVDRDMFYSAEEKEFATCKVCRGLISIQSVL